ncbi:DNA primase small subunit [Patella vulgata]|uniref:DNA primase small subunit n=1 Tax=Patella vulgata TaxID=6465 RepID=UPI00217F262C|nr:DNA primase small subunit [Patella vulgata]
MSEKNNYDPASLPDLLPVYYKRLFPYGPYFRWLHYGGVPKTYFLNREFSFTLKDDVYIRYQSFVDQSDLEKEIQKHCPYKIDIGAVFSYKPKERKTIKASAFQAQEKELVFDIDMTDYDDVRKCCSGADICEKCWPLMKIACKIIHAALVDDFGFKHILWVYSGRRGVHCWVCDEEARKLSQTGRTAIAEYLSLVRGGENQTKKVSLDETLHPSIRRALNIIEGYFDKYSVKKQDFLNSPEQWDKVLALIPIEDVRKQINGLFDSLGTNSSTRLTILREQLNNAKEHKKMKMTMEEIMVQLCYPRLDVNVSKGVNHLLKSPFCVHPKTGRVCVPFDVSKVDSFNPFTVPTISQLLDEIDNCETTDTTKKVKDFKKTSLAASIEVFEKFLKNLEESWKGKLLEQSDIKMEF